MEKILFLGGSKQQVPAIEYAKNAGYYTILCDYLSDNPGQYVADKFYCSSTTDLDEMLRISTEEDIDGIVAYASDPAALTAAFVGNKLNLKSNPLKSVEILSKKNLFREFLKENGFNCPKTIALENLDNIKEKIANFNYPLMVKPIDSSGSKGISKVKNIDELKMKFNIAMNQSRGKIVVIEEFIERDHDYMIGGDAFIVDKKVAYFGLLNSHRDFGVNELVPDGTSYPTFLSKERQIRVEKEVQKVVDILNMKDGAINLELMFDTNDKLYIIEIGPRNGGNMIPDILYQATGVDMIKATVDSAMGKDVELESDGRERYLSTYVIHSNKSGILNGITFSEVLKKSITKSVMYKNIGEEVEFFDGANKAIGILFLKFESLEEEKNILSKINELVTLDISSI